VDRILARHDFKRSELIAILQEIQGMYRYLPEEALNLVATALGCSTTEVFAVATFYAQFSPEPKGKYLVRVCDGTACHVKNSQKILTALARHLKLSEGRYTSADGLFTLETVACLGACGIAPVMVVNDVVHSQVTPDAALTILKVLNERDGAPVERAEESA
jgi:NADH-quinone oxidoreductase subunit E